MGACNSRATDNCGGTDHGIIYPPPYAVTLADDVDCIMRKALDSVLKCYAGIGEMQVLTFNVEHNKKTVRVLSQCVYGSPIDWDKIDAYVRAAQRQGGSSLVLPAKLAKGYLQTTQTYTCLVLPPHI